MWQALEFRTSTRSLVRHLSFKARMASILSNRLINLLTGLLRHAHHPPIIFATSRGHQTGANTYGKCPKYTARVQFVPIFARSIQKEVSEVGQICRNVSFT